MQNDDGQLEIPPYLFQRVTATSTDTLMMGGRGPPNAINGLTRSLFRPSDDAVTFPLNIPGIARRLVTVSLIVLILWLLFPVFFALLGNAMICVEISHLTDLLTQLQKLQPDNAGMIGPIQTLAEQVGGEICNVLREFVETKEALPYEIDGNGGEYYMDDANVPSLLSLPVLGFISADHEAYSKTRNYVWSKTNPFYYSGTAADGIGGPHVGTNYAWPMAFVVKAMTSKDDNEITKLVTTLLENTAGTGLMHESFNVNNSDNYTRSWFAWANGLFGELILQLIHTNPSLVLKDDPDTIALAQSLVKPPISIEAQNSPLILTKGFF